MQNFRKITKLRCREICKLQNREINVSQKFHVITKGNYEGSTFTQLFQGQNFHVKRLIKVALGRDHPLHCRPYEWGLRLQTQMGH